MSSSEILKDVMNMEETVKCKVCKNLLCDPLIIGKCGHTLCKNCFEGISDSKCPVCRVLVNSRDSLEDKQLKEALVQLNKLKNILQIEQNLNKNHASEDPETSKAEIAYSGISHALAAITNGNKMNSPKCSTPKTKTFLSKNASKVSSSEESIVEETQ
ncbi:BRCA1-associated RING domain protein 1, partial [Stegodyphus mimosarum]